MIISRWLTVLRLQTSSMYYGVSCTAISASHWLYLHRKAYCASPKCVSPLEDFTEGKFQELIDDTFVDTKKVKRVLLCTGKIYYDLLEKQQVINVKM
jgi:2-oxoglutarate dehydrogenase complex dehydrogenase (E1) component-like enzyme